MSQTPGMVDEDNLDGVTREQLVAAQIAKHKEILQPDSAPVVVRLTAVESTLRDIREVLDDILVVLQKKKNAEDQTKNKS
jgi:hypothetical protein